MLCLQESGCLLDLNCLTDGDIESEFREGKGKGKGKRQWQRRLGANGRWSIPAVRCS